uniref:receptor protein-tyrosine kinase n=1 Tax=Macrostomum lignano TaxID=282301 RepID=A0A1I8GEQ5_9PLAT
MHYQLIAILLLATVTNGREFELLNSRSIVIDDSVSSNLLNETSFFRSDVECLSWCNLKLCVAVVVNDTSKVCQMAVINDESTGQPGPNGSHVTRQLGSPNDLAVRVWKAEDFEAQLKSKAPISDVVFKNSSTGRSGLVQNYTINSTGCYRIQAYGAAGGSTTVVNAGVRPGYGAYAAVNYNLTAGAVLKIVVGQAGENVVSFPVGAGGGGGSFVYIEGDTYPILVAGGGGAMSGFTPGKNFITQSIDQEI